MHPSLSRVCTSFADTGVPADIPTMPLTRRKVAEAEAAAAATPSGGAPTATSRPDAVPGSSRRRQRRSASVESKEAGAVDKNAFKPIPGKSERCVVLPLSARLLPPFPTGLHGVLSSRVAGASPGPACFGMFQGYPLNYSC